MLYATTHLLLISCACPNLHHEFASVGHPGASAPADSRRFIAPGLRARESTTTATPSIDATSASVVAAAYWGTMSPHPVTGGRIPRTVDAQIFVVGGRVYYGSPSPAVDVHGSSFVDLL
jgi:hypothetical protein